MTGWRADILDGYEACELDLGTAEPAPGEPEDSLCATLIHRIGEPSRRAVLYVHGWNDYFFQTHLGDFFTECGYDFYAIDLRRYGRSLRPGQFPGYITSLDAYDAELDAALGAIRAAAPRDEVILMGHSTGGLITALWVADHPGEIDGLILNSPWLDLQGSAVVRAIGTSVVDALAGRGLGTTQIPVPGSDIYARSLRADRDGEWEYDLDWKAAEGGPILIGWIRAIRHGHQRVAAGLGIDIPILVMASARSSFRRRWRAELMSVDTVLDVEQIAARATRLGRNVTIQRFDGGLHDLILSRRPVRDQVFADMAAWVGGHRRKRILPSLDTADSTR